MADLDLNRLLRGGMDLATAFGRGDDAYNTALAKRAQVEGLVIDARSKRDASMARDELSGLLMESGNPADRQRALAVRSGVNPQLLGLGGKTNEAFTLSPGSKRFGADGKVIAEVPFAPANAQFVEVPDGAGGTVKMVFDPRTRGFQMPQYGGSSMYEDGSPVNLTSGVGPNGQPFNFDPNMPAADRAAAMADVVNGGASDSYTLPPSSTYQFGRKPPKQKDPPAGYRWGADGQTMEMIPGGPAQVAADARDAARQARQDAADAKAEQKRQGETARQKEAAESANSLISALDRLERSPGFSGLGSVMGDFKQGVPYFRNDVKDSQAQLENIRSQVVLATMSKLKALSSSGATGFGALSEKELAVLQNALASLDSAKISNNELKASIKVIREAMRKVSTWAPSEAAPIDDERQSLLDKY